MLRFYIVADERPNPRPTELSAMAVAGELAEEAFENLQRKRIIETRLSYYQNFRWSSTLVKMKLQLLLHQHPQLHTATAAATSEQQLFFILLNASAQHAGLIAIAE
jgi:hypothetical protein